MRRRCPRIRLMLPWVACLWFLPRVSTWYTRVFPRQEYARVLILVLPRVSTSYTRVFPASSRRNTRALIFGVHRTWEIRHVSCTRVFTRVTRVLCFTRVLFCGSI